jgi:hypothetical protein
VRGGGHRFRREPVRVIVSAWWMDHRFASGMRRFAVVELIASTTTKTGLVVRCELDDRIYPKGIKVSDDEMASINIKGDAFHPEWNYTISPSVPP